MVFKPLHRGDAQEPGEPVVAGGQFLHRRRLLVRRRHADEQVINPSPHRRVTIALGLAGAIKHLSGNRVLLIGVISGGG